MPNGTNRFRDSLFFQILEVLTILLGLPGLVLLVCNAFSVPNNIAHVISLALLLVSAVFLFGMKYIRRVLVVVLLGLCIILAAALWFTRHKPKDAWVQWKEKAFESIQNCGPNDNSCVAAALTQTYPGPDADLVMARLGADERAGTIIMQHPRVIAMLDSQLGIKTSFLGFGLAEPIGENNYSAARVPEYLVPNYADSFERVWTWRLDPIGDSEKVLSDVIEKEAPIKQGSDLKGKLAFIKNIKTHFSLDDKTPAVVRISQFPPSNYSGRLGLPAAKRVFVIHLGEVWKMKLKDVAKYSGRTLRTNADAQTEKLFVWLFLPTDPDEVVPGTWGEILQRLPGWIK